MFRFEKSASFDQRFNQKIEFKQGCSNTTPGNCNSVSSCRKRSSFLADVSGKFLFVRHTNIVLLLSVIYSCVSGILCPDEKQRQEQIVLFTGLLILLVTLAAVYVFAEFSEELPRRLRDRQVNNQKCRRLLRRVRMLAEKLVFLEEVRWGCVKVGDFVVLRKGEGCPAEVLVVHCRSSIVKINPEGEENPEIPYKNRLNIQELNFLNNEQTLWYDARQYLNGTVYYNRDTLQGELELIGPGVPLQHFDQSYILHRNSSPYSTILGLVLRVGQQQSTTKWSSNKSDYFTKKMQLFSAFTMLFFVAFSVFEMFIEIVIQRPQLGNGFLYMNFRLFPWAVIFPYTMYGVYDLMRVGFVLVYLVNARRRKGSEEGKNREEEGEGLECCKVDENDSRTFLRQDNPSAPVFYGSKQQNLGLCTHLLFQPSELLQPTTCKVSLIYLGGQIYRVNQTFKQTITTEKPTPLRRFSSQKTPSTSSNYISSLDIKSKKTLLPLNMLLEDSQSGIEDLCCAMTLLSEQYQCQYDDKNKKLCFERTIWRRFCDAVGLATHLVWQEKTVQFCLGVDFHRYGCRYFVGRDFMACLVEDLEVAEEKYFMLWRYKYGCNPLESVEGDEMFRANKAAMSMIKLGSIPYVFMKMQLTQEEYKRYSGEMQTAMTIVEELKVQVDKDRVDLLGVAGVERECQVEFKQTLKEIAESKTKVVFVSGEGLAEMQIFINGLYEKEVPEMIHLHPGCEYTTIIEQNCRRFTKFATTDKSLRPDHYIELQSLPTSQQPSKTMRIDNPQTLSSLTHITPYLLLMDGKSFSSLLPQRKSLQQLGFLLQFSSNCFFYNMPPWLKGQLTEFIRQYQYSKEKVTVACVAGGYGSREMMGRSDCAVYVGKKGLVKGYFDLVVQELREVPRIMAKQSQQKITILWYMIRMVAYISVLHGAVQITFTKVPYFMNNQLFLLVLTNVVNAFVFGLLLFQQVKSKPTLAQLQWQNKHLNQQFKIDHHLDFLLNVFLKSFCDGAIVYGVTTHFYVWFEDFEMGMYTINQIYLVGVFTFRIVLTFPVSLKSMLLGFVLFVESLLTYSFLRANTLASYAGFLGQLVTYKEVYIEVIMLVLWTILTRDFIGLLLPVQIGKAKVSKVFRTIRETTIILKQDFLALKYKIFSQSKTQPLPTLLLSPDTQPLKLTQALLSPTPQPTAMQLFYKATNRFKTTQIRINFFKIIAIQVCCMLVCYPISNANLFLSVLFLLANFAFVIWQDSDDKGWIYSLGILSRVLTAFGFVYQQSQFPPPITLQCLILCVSLGFLHNVLVLATALVTICIIYMARMFTQQSYTMFGNTNYFQVYIPNAVALVVLARHLFRVYDMRTVLKREIRKATTQSQLENVVGLVMPRMVWERIVGDTVVMPGKEENMAFAMCVFETSQVYPMEKREVLTQYYEKLYQKLDRLCGKHELIRGQSHGNVYLALKHPSPTPSSTPNSNPSSSPFTNTLPPFKSIVSCMRFAFSVLELSQNQQQLKNCNMKVIIGYGGVYQCVLGYHRPQFTIIGEQLNTAARIARQADSNQFIYLTHAAYGFVNTANEVFFSEMRLEGNGNESGNEGNNGNNGMSYYAARRRRNSSVELKVLNITLGVKAAVRIMASEMSELPEMTMENVEVLISQCRPDFEDLRYDHFYQVKPPATPKIREPADPNTPYRLPLFSILTYAAFTRVIGIVHLVPWYLGLHITVFVIFAAGYYLSPSYKWFYLFLVMLVARGVGFPEAGEDLLLSFALLGNFNIFQCLVLIAANYHSLASAIPTCLLLLYDHSTYNSQILTPLVTSPQSLLQITTQKRQLLLSNLLPKPILQQYLTNPTFSINYEQTFPNATILFADITGYMQYKKTTTAGCAVETLKTIFKRFDVECLKANLFRVRIVGDGYVVWGVNEQTALRNPGKEAKDCIELGMRMIKIVEEVCEFKAKNVGVRIGIHTGRITGGIAVADHLKYELYGPEVMVAQEMERRGMRNAVQVSEATKAVLNEDEARFYKFRQYSVVRVNQREVLGYLVEPLFG